MTSIWDRVHESLDKLVDARRKDRAAWKRVIELRTATLDERIAASQDVDRLYVAYGVCLAELRQHIDEALDVEEGLVETLDDY